VQRFAIDAMATRFELVLADAAPGVGELLLDEIANWHHCLNRFAPDSWVAHANRTAATTPVRCDEDVWALLMDAQSVWRASDGAFDITRGFGHALVLTADTRTLTFNSPAMQLDFGGIAKGHALDCCGRLLREHGVTDAFLHGGTSSGLAIGLDPTTGEPWRVCIGVGEALDPPSPRLRRGKPWAFSVSAAASQSDPHIVDPRTRSPIRTQCAVSVTGPSARLCEAWSTAAVVLAGVAQPPQGYNLRAMTAGII
jgi:thiamine biosynthesis lipoprotein